MLDAVCVSTGMCFEEHSATVIHDHGVFGRIIASSPAAEQDSALGIFDVYAVHSCQSVLQDYVPDSRLRDTTCLANRDHSLSVALDTKGTSLTPDHLSHIPDATFGSIVRRPNATILNEKLGC